MAEGHGVIYSIQQKSPSSNKLLGLVTLATAGIVTLVLGTVTTGAVALTLLLATPVFLFFSPILVPIGILIALTIGGFLFASTVFVAFCSFVSWVFNYLRGKRPVGADRIESAKHTIVDMASHATGFLHSKAHEVAH